MKLNLNWTNTQTNNNRKIGLQFSMLNTGLKPERSEHSSQSVALSGAMVKIDPRFYQR
jgi:hypothetical protein